MLSVHPEFDVSTNTWFWNEFEAPTLRQLKKLVGSGTRINDYYPDGFDGAIIMRFVANEKKKEAIRVAPPSVSNLGYTTRPHFRKHDKDKILDLWKEGKSAIEIAALCGGGLSESVARSTVMVARKKGDPRAVRRIRKD